MCPSLASTCDICVDDCATALRLCLSVRLSISEQTRCVEIEAECTLGDHSQTESLDGNCDIGVDACAATLRLWLRVRLSGERPRSVSVRLSVSEQT